MATVTLYHDTRSGKDTFPVKLRIAHKKEKAYILLGIKVAIDEWDSETCRIIGNKNAKTYNATLIARLGAASSHIANLDLLGKTNKLSASQIRDIIENGGEILDEHQEHNFYEYYTAAMNAKTEDKTRSSYQQALINLEKFDPQLKERTFEELDYKYMERFDNWFEERGVSVNSRAVYYRNIRAVFNDAADDELTDNYPFKRFKIKKTPTKKRNLSIEELRLLKNFPTTYGMHAKYRDIFMLMFYMRGINAVDIFALKESNIRHGRIDYIRSKTGKPYSVKIEPEMQEIFDRYKGKEYLLDVCDGAKDKKEWTAKYEGFLHRMDRGLKKIGPVTWSKQQGPSPIFDPILPHISQYWCRHTTATLMQKLGVSVDLIACSLGHDHGNKTTNIYIEYSQDEVDKSNRALIDYVNQN
jgi:integrase